MNELERICLGYRILAGAAHPAYLATTLIGVDRSPAQSGKRLLFARNRLVAGSLGNIRLDAEIARRGPELLRSGRPLVVHSDGDAVRVLLECVGPRTPGPLPLVEGCLREERRGAIVTVIATDRPGLLGARVQVGPDASPPSPALEGELRERLFEAARDALTEGLFASRRFGAVEAFVEPIEPPPHLFVFGPGTGAKSRARTYAPSVVTLAQSQGWRVTYHDPTGLSSARDHFPRHAAVFQGTVTQAIELLNRAARPLAVVVSELKEADPETLAALLHSRALYVGVLGLEGGTPSLLGQVASDRGVSATSHVCPATGFALDVRSATDSALSLVAGARTALENCRAHAGSAGRAPVHLAARAIFGGGQ